MITPFMQVETYSAMLCCGCGWVQVHTTYEDGVHAVLFSSVPDLDVKPEWVERARARTQSVSAGRVLRVFSGWAWARVCKSAAAPLLLVSLRVPLRVPKIVC